MIKDKGEEALEKLVQDAKLFCTLLMKQTGKVPPTLFMHGMDGKAVFTPGEFTSVESKDEFARAARLMCVAHGADATVFVSEAWMRMAVKDQKLDLSTPPSESLDRQEILFIIGESREDHIFKAVPIIRTDNGKFVGFGETPEVRGDQTKGRFSHFLTEEIPNEDLRRKAKRILEEMGLVQGKDHRREQGYGRTRF